MPLKSIKVLELAGLAPAPFCGMILADFGAQVTRVDKIGSNTDLDPLGNGKKSLSLNLKHEKGIKIFKSLCKNSDVLIEPFRKGVMEKLGVAPNILLKDNPRLVYARLSGYGQTGSFSKNAGHDINYVALSGLLSMLGRSKDKPLPPINLLADFGGGGLLCALGILLALLERNNSGMGQVVDNSMVRGTAYLGSWVLRSQHLPLWGNERGKNILDSGSHFYQIYETKDGKFMSVGALEPQFYDALLLGLDLTENDAPQYGDFKKLKLLFAKKFLEKTQEEWSQIFDSTDACVAPVLGLQEAVEHKHNVVDDTFHVKGNIIVPNPAPKLSRTPGKSSGLAKAPKLGQHSRDILRELNFCERDITNLEEDGVVECYKKAKL